MSGHHLKPLATPSLGRRIAAVITAVAVLVLALGGLGFRLLLPGGAVGGHVRPDHGTKGPSVSLLVSRTHTRVAQYVLSATTADATAAEDSLAELTERIATLPVIGLSQDNLAILAGRYRASVLSLFKAVDLRRSGIDRMLSAGTEIRTIASSIVLALAAETDPDLIRAGMALAQTFEASDAAATRLLASRTPPDSNIPTPALATMPIDVDALARLAGKQRRIERLVAALGKPLGIYAAALRDVMAANERLRVDAGRRDAASEAVLAAAAFEGDRLARSERVVLAVDTVLIVLCLFLLLPLLVTQFRRLKTATAALRNKSAMLETTLSNMDQGLIMVTAERKVGVFNDRALYLLGLPPDAMREGVPFDDVVDHQRQGVRLGGRADDQRALQPGGFPAELQAYRRRRPDGAVLEIRSAPLPGGGMVRTYTDVTERKPAESRVLHAARRDGVTNLADRTTFAEDLGKAVVDAGRDGGGLAVLFIDLDRLRLVDDTLGHPMRDHTLGHPMRDHTLGHPMGDDTLGHPMGDDTLGHPMSDELLREVACRMLTEVREADTLTHLGGDGFALVMPGVRDPWLALATAERLRSSVSEPYALSHGTAWVRVSIGISCHPIHASNADELLNRADRALNRAKALSDNMCCVFDQALDNRRQDEPTL